MVRVYAVLSVLSLILWVYCLVDAITTDESRIRNAPKTLWIIVVFFAPLLGSLLWLIAGRPRSQQPDLPYKGNTGRAARSGYPEYERPGRAVATNPDDDEEFLRRCRERAEEQRRKADQTRQADERISGPADADDEPGS